MTIVEKIEASPATPSQKIVQLYAVVILNYRLPIGDAAWAAMKRITGNEEYVSALAFLMGVTMADQDGPRDRAIWVRLLQIYDTPRT